MYANRLKIHNVSILFNLLIGETIFFFGISKNPAATQFDRGLFDRYVTTKTKQFRRLYLMQRYIAETWEYLF